ncbi:sodium/bile acid cotransporter 7-B-like [Corticium candelabrum]|uniref:sodium/bile acid cotransporter 7-B-like n=1 Tax=Corticium candelabrum TaxID=121492 RepID=UPI002E27071B|nr:sodium/bile acid cotransporter 7-B-like [Corticium candelabrum]
MSLWARILGQWFLIGLVVSILAAKVQPEVGKKGGLLKPEITIKYIAVSVIFLNSGLSLRTDDLKKALFSIRLHAFIQIFTLVFIPFAIFFLVWLLSYSSLNIWLQKGLLVVSCMPPPVSSAVILTKAVGGNEAAAIFNSAFGSFLGIFVTPLLLLFLVGASGAVPVQSVFTTLFMTVVAPVLIGQVIRSFVREWLDKANLPFGALGKLILLVIIYTTFCDTFASASLDIESTDMAVIIIVVLLCQLSFLTLSFMLSTRVFKGFRPSDVVAIVFCSTHKSLTLGIPMLKIMYSGYSHLSLISIPLLVYHPTQILLGGFLVPFVRSWMVSATSRQEAIEKEIQETCSGNSPSSISA